MTSHLTTDQLTTLIDAGLTAEQLRVVARIFAEPTPRSKNAERQARFRERRRNGTRSVTDNVTKRDPSPLGPPSFPHTPYHPPIIPPTGAADDERRDALGWPSVRTEWVDRLIDETGCADPARETWPRLTAAVLLDWHEIDRFDWRDVTAGVRRVMARAPDPPSSWRYFAKAIAHARQNRTQRTPDPVNDPPFRAQSPSRPTAYLVAAVNQARQRRDG